MNLRSVKIVCGTSCSDIRVCSIPNLQKHHFPELSYAQKTSIDTGVIIIIECNTEIVGFVA